MTDEQHDHEHDYKPKRTQVRAGSASVFGQTQQAIVVYEPMRNSAGEYDVDSDGNLAKVTRLGAVKIGSLGEIVGQVVRVPSRYLENYQKTASFGTELTEMVPVEFTEYKRVGWVPVSQIVVIG